MILIDNFSQVMAQIESERGISKDLLVSAVEQALVSACRRRYHDETLLEAKVDPFTGEATIYLVRDVVKDVENEHTQIEVKEAKKIDPKAKEGARLLVDVTPQDFGRIAAQTAKQVIIQRIREAEKNVIFADFKDKVGKVILGTVQRVENENYLVNLGLAESILSARDQIPGEHFQAKEKIRVYVVDIDKNSRGSLIRISRTHPGLLRELLVNEIPEIQDGIISIMSVSREPGVRSKVAVKSNNPAIGAVGTCVGHMGTRIQTVTKELGREKIDVLEWSDEPKLFIANALKPAKVTDIFITNEKDKTAIVVVPNDQLSLAIGKAGVNIRLAVKLTGWKLDVMSDEEFAKKEPELKAKTHVSIVDKIRLEKEKEREEAKQKVKKQDAPVKAVHVADEPHAPAKMKISDLAKMLGVKTKELVDKGKTLGMELTLKTVLDETQIDQLKAVA